MFPCEDSKTVSVCPSVRLSVCPHPEKRNPLSFVNISPTIVIDTSMERSSRVLHHEKSIFFYIIKKKRLPQCFCCHVPYTVILITTIINFCYMLLKSFMRHYYASPSSGEAYRDRQLTTNFEFWVEIFCVPTCFHVRIPKPCLSVRLSVCPSVRTPRKEITIASSISVPQ